MTISTDARYLDFLSENDKKYYFGQPLFCNEERRRYFDLSETECEYFRNLKGQKSKFHYLLLSGYFKASNMFFNTNKINIPEEDIAFISKRFQLQVKKLPISQTTAAKHIGIICRVFKVSPYSQLKHRQILALKTANFIKMHVKPMFIFSELLKNLHAISVTMPSYREFQIIIGSALKNEEDRLSSLLENVPKETSNKINQLLRQNQEFNLSHFIALPKNVSNKEIKKELIRLNEAKAIYQFSCDFLPQLSISQESIKYYSSLVKYYGRSKLSRMKSSLVPLYVLCYIYHRCQRIHDNLVQVFQALVSKYYTGALVKAKEIMGQMRFSFEAEEENLADVLDFYVNNKRDDMPFSKVREEALMHVDSATLSKATSYMRNKQHKCDKLLWELLGDARSKFKKNLRKIFIALDFTSGHQAFNETCIYLKSRVCQGDRKINAYTDAPMASIPQRIMAFLSKNLNDTEMLEPGRFEFFIYHQLSQYLTAGSASLSDSVQFKSFDEDLISEEVAQSQNFTALGMPILDMPIQQHLGNLRKVLEEQIEDTNQNISLGLNQSINIKDWGNRKWTLPYRKQDIDCNHQFFEKLPHTNIVDIIHFVHEQTNFLSIFSHILTKNIKSTINNDVLSAAIIAKATNHGIYRMSKISNISLGVLRQYNNSYVTIENIKGACNLIADKIKRLPIFKLYNINSILHGGIDGQKFKTKRDCLKARPSSKYFHVGKGVSSSTLLINHVPANAMLFGANEHESRFVFDLVYNNETEIQPEIISTDSAGSNFVNFSLLHFIGREFAPCFKTITNKESMLVGFQKATTYRDCFIRPRRQVKEKLIIDEWQNIKRIAASMVLKKSTQSILVRKLSSQSDKNRTKEALWEYDSIIRSIYLMKYLDDEGLRQSVRTALNRNEAFHQLKRTIASINSENLIGQDDDDLVINDECTRLLSLVVIYYNAYLLSEALKIKERFGTQEEVAAFKHISIVAWVHVNFYGHYNFHSSLSSDKIKEMLNSVIFEPDILFNVREVR